MSLQCGTTLSTYRILGQVGSGAMGEVWRARDTKLDRIVAIKVLPDAFVKDEQRTRRFDREARMLARLNHPNVSAIHGREERGPLHYLVLEYVPGRTLHEVLEKGPLDVEQALDVMRQIAEGLEAAHEAGLVHRDLKPSNVKITPDGHVKILDFGLAKSCLPRPGSDSDSIHASAEGLVIGTPAYMSPEHAAGKRVDRRTDIWAFGCLLYECLTARRAFAGVSMTDVFLRVMSEDPDFEALPADVPEPVVRLLRRTLVKDPLRRLRDIGEARLVLEHPASFELRPRPEVPSDLVRTGELSAFAWSATAGLALLLGFLWKGGESAPATERSHVTRWHVHAVDEARVGDHVRSLRLAPNGRTVAISVESRAAGNGIRLRDFDSPELRTVPGTADAVDFSFSEDGGELVLADGDDGVEQRVPLARGGALVGSLAVFLPSWAGGRTERGGAQLAPGERGRAPTQVALPSGGSALVWAHGDRLFGQRYDQTTKSLEGRRVALDVLVALRAEDDTPLYDARGDALAYVPADAPLTVEVIEGIGLELERRLLAESRR